MSYFFFRRPSEDRPLEDLGSPDLVRREIPRHELRHWLPWGAIVLTAVTLLVSLGYCQPTGNAETITAARVEHARIEAENRAAVDVLAKRDAAIEAANDKEHEVFRSSLKELTEKIYGVQLEQKNAMILILNELRGAGSAPTGQEFRHGRRIEK